MQMTDIRMDDWARVSLRWWSEGFDSHTRQCDLDIKTGRKTTGYSTTNWHVDRMKKKHKKPPLSSHSSARFSTFHAFSFRHPFPLSNASPFSHSSLHSVWRRGLFVCTRPRRSHEITPENWPDPLTAQPTHTPNCLKSGGHAWEHMNFIDPVAKWNQRACPHTFY